MHRVNLQSTEQFPRDRDRTGTARSCIKRCLSYSSFVAALVCALLLFSATQGRAHPLAKGLPFTRIYSFEEIGDITHANSLTFDQRGRIAIVHRGAYVVLNDNAWIDIADKDLSNVRFLSTAPDTDGRIYFGGVGSWGLLATTPDGKLRPQPFHATKTPDWVAATSFTDVLVTSQGVYFSGWNGVVFWDPRNKTHRFFEIRGVARVFAMGEKIYVSSHGRGVQVLDPANETVADSDRHLFGASIVDNIATLGVDHALASTTRRQLLVWRDGIFVPLAGPFWERLPGRITAIQSLPEGLFAVAVTGGGLYILDDQGQLRTSLNSPEYHRINALACNEPGVLWAAAENGVTKILYGQSVTTFSQPLGLPISWPQVVVWDNRLVVASNGRLYEPIPDSSGTTTHFQLMSGQPASGAWGIAASGPWLLVANKGVSAKQSDGRFVSVMSEIDPARLVAIEDGTCFVIGTNEIAALRWAGNAWTECAPRIPGLGYPYVGHAAKNSAWIELGANRAARLSIIAGRLQAQVFEPFSSPDSRWVNVSIVGDTVVMVGPDQRTVFFDEKSEALVEAPGAIKAVFDASPYPVGRVVKDDSGRWWVSHEHGVLSLSENDGRFSVDASSYDVINENVPLVQALPGSDIWISTGETLYHVEKPVEIKTPPRFRPVLVSARNSRTRDELPLAARSLSYAENSLTFQFFSGSYASRRTPAYEFKLNTNPWSSLGSTSSLNLSDLHEGSYQLGIRLVSSRGPVGDAAFFDFSVAPPWYRTWYAIAIYAIGATGLVLILIQLSLHRAETRNAALEKLVAERTTELKSTMEKLQQETRTAATLAERNRLAGEIHDSLEQGFSGLLLQLESTSNFEPCPPEVKNGLLVARNMVTFSRNEVRHAVWDLHSSMLDEADLETAVKLIISQIAPEPTHATVTVVGSSHSLGSTIEHHLLRIVQEAIANAVKHAAATHLEILLTFSETEVRLSIRDNGCGFDPGKILNGPIGHFGLRSLRGRASKIGATLEILSQPGKGARVEVHVPLNKGAIA